ncbi:heparin lyase I family protein [Ideonella margarita]|uniref:Heparin lyase I family protein n=1 Tax=Ideonella margarita TaxID=2984191 RepID=A0ABU9C1E2_9BURK
MNQAMPLAEKAQLEMGEVLHGHPEHAERQLVVLYEGVRAIKRLINAQIWARLSLQKVWTILVIGVSPSLGYAQSNVRSVENLDAELKQGYKIQASEQEAAKLQNTREQGAVVQFTLSPKAEKVANGWRVEYRGTTAPINTGKPIWYAFSYYQTADWLKWKKPVVIGQVHTAQPGPITVPPPLGLMVRGGILNVVLHSTNSSPLMIAKDQNRLIPRKVVPTGPAKPGEWTCVLVRAVWSSEPGQGELAVWRDSKQVIDSMNVANAYPTPLGMYPKFGLYAYDGVDANDMVLEADVVRVLDGKLTPDQVRQRARCAAH